MVLLKTLISMICLKLRKNYYFSVEGETEKWYLKWLENQINNNENSLFKVNFTVYVQKILLQQLKG